MNALADRRGSAAVELALLAPLFFAMVLGILEIGRMLTVHSMVEHGARLASRAGITGTLPAGYATREDYIRAILAAATRGFVDPARLTVELLSYQSFDAVGKPEPFIDKNGNGRWDAGEAYTDVNGNGKWDADQGRSGIGGASQVALYLIRYQDRPLTRLMVQLMGASAFTYESRIVVRNEPFDAT
jgi:Flp pilus assembly protein TadG